VPTFTAPDGVRLHYQIEGEGPALVLHLGAGCDADPDDLMGKAASLMPAATRLRIPGREHINAFLASDVVLPSVRDFLLGRGGES
jgi:hypothetical protein